MNGIVEYLRSFNRKERFFLVGAALGNPEFRLSDEFRESINAALGLDVPPHAFVAMDYHLDWIYASLYLWRHGVAPGPHSNLDKLVRAQQEDIDLVIAYSSSSNSHIVLLEAKGVTGWTNKQMVSKAARLTEIFGTDGGAWSGVAPDFALVSPRPPQRLDTTTWPAWMLRDGRVPWIELTIGQDLKRITRCTLNGVVSATGQYWKVVNERPTGRPTQPGSEPEVLESEP